MAQLSSSLKSSDLLLEKVILGEVEEAISLIQSSNYANPQMINLIFAKCIEIQTMGESQRAKSNLVSLANLLAALKITPDLRSILVRVFEELRALAQIKSISEDQVLLGQPQRSQIDSILKHLAIQSANASFDASLEFVLSNYLISRSYVLQGKKKIANKMKSKINRIVESWNPSPEKEIIQMLIAHLASTSNTEKNNQKSKMKGFKLLHRIMKKKSVIAQREAWLLITEPKRIVRKSTLTTKASHHLNIFKLNRNRSCTISPQLQEDGLLRSKRLDIFEADDSQVKTKQKYFFEQRAQSKLSSEVSEKYASRKKLLIILDHPKSSLLHKTCNIQIRKFSCNDKLSIYERQNFIEVNELRQMVTLKTGCSGGGRTEERSGSFKSIILAEKGRISPKKRPTRKNVDLTGITPFDLSSNIVEAKSPISRMKKVANTIKAMNRLANLCQPKNCCRSSIRSEFNLLNAFCKDRLLFLVKMIRWKRSHRRIWSSISDLRGWRGLGNFIVSFYKTEKEYEIHYDCLFGRVHGQLSYSKHADIAILQRMFVEKCEGDKREWVVILQN